MADDALTAGLGLAGAVAPSVVGLITTLVERFASDPKGTEEKVAKVYDQILALLGPSSAAEGALAEEREKALEIARKLLAAKLSQPAPAPEPPVGPDPRVVAPPDNGPPPWLREQPAQPALPAPEPAPADPAPVPAPQPA